MQGFSEASPEFAFEENHRARLELTPSVFSVTLCFNTTTLPTTYCIDYCLLPRKRSRHVTFHRSPLSHMIVPARTLTIARTDLKSPSGGFNKRLPNYKKASTKNPLESGDLKSET